MINRDPRCVHVTNTMGDAVVTATWLTSRGIAAQVMDMMIRGGLEGLTGGAPGVSARGMEVWVLDSEDATAARELLAEHEASKAQQAAEAEQRGPIQVICDECGQPTVFPPDQYGSIQDCPHCGAYLDVEDAESASSPEEVGEGADDLPEE